MTLQTNTSTRSSSHATPIHARGRTTSRFARSRAALFPAVLVLLVGATELVGRASEKPIGSDPETGATGYHQKVAGAASEALVAGDQADQADQVESADVQAAATKSKTVYSHSGGTKVLAYYQSKSDGWHVIGVHVTDVKCDDSGSRGFAPYRTLGSEPVWDNSKGCGKDVYFGSLNERATAICACDLKWFGCRNLNCVSLD